MNVLLFGILAEKAGSDRLELDAPTTHGLRQRFLEKVEGVEGMNFAVAVDRTIVHEDMPLNGDEEIAMLPPFAGG
jgi:sulfur-carrier protein